MVKFNDKSFEYAQENTKFIAFPVGGIGAGMFCVEGSGLLSHFSLRHHPDVLNEPNMYAAVSVNGTARVLEGPVQGHKVFGGACVNYEGFGTGTIGRNYGLPRFTNNTFRAAFPFCEVNLTDEAMPVSAKISAWSPFIPKDADNSSLPVGSLEYTITNDSDDNADGVFYFVVPNFIGVGDDACKPLTLSNGNGFTFYQPSNGRAKFFDKAWFSVTADEDAYIDCDWFRGGWFDVLTMNWNNILKGEYASKPASVDSQSPGATIAVPFKLAKGESKTVRLYISWYVPNSNLRCGHNFNDNWNRNDPNSYYRPWYSSKFEGIDAVSAYWQENYCDLKAKTKAFSDKLFALDVPEIVLNSVAANLSILKSPTVMRQADGRFWGWEGCQDHYGSCHGSCTHVWNYAQALCNLFPDMERSLRETEFKVSQNDDGHQNFRSSLPLREPDHWYHAASDGQLGGIIKLYRDWKICGDDNWLKGLFPYVIKSLEYGIKTWDPDENGYLLEPHHNTYDIEFWGADIMCTSFYLGALKAAAAMAEYFGEAEFAARWLAIYEKGKVYAETELYNGEYFIQKVQWKGMRATLHTVHEPKSTRELLEVEGPKYQYGTGCLSDGILGAWLSKLAGLGDILDPEKMTSHLMSIHKYNLKRSLAAHSNPQRPGYAIGNEGGLLLCSWPHGNKPSLPFVYSDEVWTGIEHQVASHLMLMGKVDEALEIEEICRARYDGKMRNPFSEIECGHWYARAMASYALIESLGKKLEV